MDTPEPFSQEIETMCRTFRWSPEARKAMVVFAKRIHQIDQNGANDRAARILKIVVEALRRVKKESGRSPIHYRPRRKDQSIYQPPLERRELKAELRSCARTLRLESSIKEIPPGLTARQWATWNLAPFFRHTSRTAMRHHGDIAWDCSSRFLAVVTGWHQPAPTLAKQWERLQKWDPPPPWDTELAPHLTRHRKKRTVSPLTVATEEAWKRLRWKNPRKKPLVRL